MTGKICPEELSSNVVHDQIAGDYGYDTDASYAAKLKYELVKRHLKAGDQVLDIGCGNGLHMRVLAPCCQTIIGIDINDPMLELARATFENEQIGNAHVDKQSATDLQFTDGAFGLVYSFSTLLLVPDFVQGLSEAYRVLKPGGLAVFDLAGRYNLSHWYWRRYYRSKGHFGLHAHSHGQLRQLLSGIGFDIVETYATGVADQLKYVPIIGRLAQGSGPLDSLVHGKPWPDLDYRLSNKKLFSPFANRWYVICRKVTG